MAKFHNPYAGGDRFVDLGEYRFGKMRGDGQIVTHHYDLYALIQSDRDISFGARYGNEDHEYLSGTAFKNQQGKWDLYCGEILSHAAARYFANHHMSN